MGLIDTVLNFFRPRQQEFVSPLPSGQSQIPKFNVVSYTPQELGLEKYYPQPQPKPPAPPSPPSLPQTPSAYNPQESIGQMLINSINDNLSRINEEYKRKGEEFDRNNPFAFDTVLAEERLKVKQRLDPYYDQTLSDFLLGVTRKKERSLEDERRLLTQLSEDTEQVVGEAKKNVELALEKSAEGYADAGLYGGGQQLREEGRIKATAEELGPGKLMRSAQRKEEELKLGTKRTLEDLSLAETLKRRDIEREREYQTQAQSLEETRRREAQRQFERSQYTGTPPAVNPSQFEEYSFGLLG